MLLKKYIITSDFGSYRLVRDEFSKPIIKLLKPMGTNLNHFVGLGNNEFVNLCNCYLYEMNNLRSGGQEDLNNENNTIKY